MVDNVMRARTVLLPLVSQGFQGNPLDSRTYVSGYWLEDFESTLSGDFAAVFARAEPKFVLDYEPFPIAAIPVLVVDAATGITLRDVLRRDELRAQKLHDNDIKIRQYIYK